MGHSEIRASGQSGVGDIVMKGEAVQDGKTTLGLRMMLFERHRSSRVMRDLNRVWMRDYRSPDANRREDELGRRCGAVPANLLRTTAYCRGMTDDR